MDLDRATHWRNVAGKAAAVFCLIFLLAAVDGLWKGFREPDRVIRLLPGESAKVNGSLKENPGTVQDLDYISSSDLIQLDFEAIHSGFWFGGYMWRGLLRISSEIRPGEYSVTVVSKGAGASKSVTAFEVRVYPDHDSYRKGSSSFILRWFNVSPWWVFGVFFLSTCLAFAIVYLLSRKREVLLAREGMAEVYLIDRDRDECLIAFGLGSSHGVQPGAQVAVLDRKGGFVGRARVCESNETDSMATPTSEFDIQPGYIVSIRI